VRLFDERSFYLTPTDASGQLFDRQQTYRQTGLMGIVSYPFDWYHRLDTGFGTRAAPTRSRWRRMHLGNLTPSISATTSRS
jgi:hypothetical protein